MIPTDNLYKRYSEFWEKVEHLIEIYLDVQLTIFQSKENNTSTPTFPDPKNINYIVTCLKRAQEGRKLSLCLGETLDNEKSGNGNDSEFVINEISKIIKSMQNDEDEE